MPRYLIEQDLRDRILLAITGRYFKGGQADIVAARRRNISHGPIANRLWRYIQEQAPLLNGVSKQRSGRRM